MKWLARLKKIDIAPEVEPTKPTKPGFVGFVGSLLAPMQKKEGDPPAANDPAPTPDTLAIVDPDRWAWPHSTAMTGSEIDTFTARLARFTDKGLTTDDGEALADKLVTRDREDDDRRLCLECRHLSGYGHTSWRCGNWEAAGVAIRPRDTQLVVDLVQRLQRCDGFTRQLQSR